jgi:hypothetical protein
MRTLALTTENIVAGTSNNTLVYQFPTSVDLTGSSIAVSNIFLYYSWNNISSSIGNNIFSYTWYDPSGVTDISTNYTITIPDGLYEVADLNAFLQFTFIQNGHYLVDDNGNFVYYAEFVVNPTRYAIQINTYPVPTALPSNWTNPANLAFPNDNFNPVITLPAKFNEILGYTANFSTSPNLTNNTNLSYLSSTAPKVQPNSNLLISITGIDNKYASPTSIIYSFSPNVGFGELIVEKPSEFNWNKIQSGMYNQLRVQLLGTDLRPIEIRDPQMTIILLIKDIDDFAMDIGHGVTPIQQEYSRSGVNNVANSILGNGMFRR